MKILNTYMQLFPDSESVIEHITRDIGDPMDIRKKGGTGQGLALFVCGSSMGRQEAPCDIVVFWRHTLIPLFQLAIEICMSGWVYILKWVPNAIFSYEDILRVIGELPWLKLEESDTDKESE